MRREAGGWAGWLTAGVLLAGAVLGTACRREATPEAATTQLQQAFPDGGGSDAVRVAISAAEAKDYPASVVALDVAKTTPGLSAGQLAAMEQARQAITADLTRRADAGDATAKAQLSAIERSRSQ